MKQLDENQLAKLEDAIHRKLGVSLNNQIEFLDHIASLIEMKMELGASFENALNEVLESYSAQELVALQEATFNRWQHKRKVRRDFIKVSLAAGLGLCFWIFGEYITGTFFGIVELGALYGLLSMVILGVAMWFGVKRLKQSTMSGRLTFGAAFKHNFKIALLAANVVLVFMLFYIPFINTELYGFHEGGNTLKNNILPFSIIIGTGVGVVIEGLIMSCAVALVRR